MALWKAFKGNRAELDAVPKHDGYIYFCVDNGTLFFDYTDADGALQRKQIHAKLADTELVIDAGGSGFAVEIDAAGGSVFNIDGRNESLAIKGNGSGGQTAIIN